MIPMLYFDADHTFILDTDSWSVGAYPCTVAMESFKDPKLVGTQFSEKTDAYSFAVLVFKALIVYIHSEESQT